MEKENTNFPSTTFIKMSLSEFKQMSAFIYQRWGICLPPAKKTLLECRLRKRLQQLQMYNFKDYCNYLFSREGQKHEAQIMIDLITTNKTEFLREPDHFSYLTKTALPNLINNSKINNNHLLIWSAGCSSGEEPYTLAMVLNEFALTHPNFKFHILATDISSRMLEIAQSGIYPEDRITPIPMEWRRKYLLRSKDPTKRLVRFTPEVRNQITFKRLNLMEIDTQINDTFQVIFCRNVIIYFDRTTQNRLLREFYRLLPPGGYLFLGHSETMTGHDIPLSLVAPTVYRKPF